MSWANALWFIGIPVARSFVGWLENAFKDKKVTPFEIRDMVGTVLRVGVIGVAAMLAIPGINVPTAMGAGVGLDFLFHALKKREIKKLK